MAWKGGLVHWRRPSDYTCHSRLFHNHKSRRIPLFSFFRIFRLQRVQYLSVWQLLQQAHHRAESLLRFLSYNPKLQLQTYLTGSDIRMCRHRRLDGKISPVPGLVRAPFPSLERVSVKKLPVRTKRYSDSVSWFCSVFIISRIFFTPERKLSSN